MSDVFFPIVGCGQSRMATVRCDCLDSKDYPAGRALVLARDEQEIERILADARATETTGSEIVRPIWVRFTPQQFTGRSYGLALALADKLARYRPDTGRDKSRLFATGIIDEDGLGKVGGVQAFAEKLSIIAKETRPGDVVVLPRANLDRLSVSEQEMLNRLDRDGVIWRSADSLGQLADLYGSSTIDEDRTTLSGEASRPGQICPHVEAATARDDPSTSNEGMNAAADLTARSHRSSPGKLLRLALMAVALLVTACAAFVAGDWSRNRSFVASYANETQPAGEAIGPNLLENPSFEQGEGQNPVGWITYSRGKHDHADRVRTGGVDGEMLLEHSSDKAFYVDTSQVLQVESGFYAFSAWIDSNGERKTNRMRARGDELLEIDIPVTARDSFQNLDIHCIEVTKGRLAVGFYMDAYKDSWAAYDNVEVVKNPKAADGRDCADIAASEEALVLAQAQPASGDNLITNPSFEQGHGQEPVGWETFSRGKYDDADRVQPGGRHGSLVLEHTSDEEFYVDTFQAIAVSNGFYALSAWINSDGEKKANRMYARGSELFEADIPTTGHDDYRQLQIHCIQATEEHLIVGFYTDTHESGLTAYDNVHLERNERTADGRACAGG